jgi:Dolichyl-phosphate-mannose-protein mannosyltransferase
LHSAFRIPRSAFEMSRLSSIVYGLAFLKLAVHLAFIRGYGWFRDEFYYIACGERLDWGYVDHPPLVAFVAALTRSVLGDSLVALRLPAALAGSLTVIAGGLLARELGAGRYGQGLAAIGVVGAIGYLALQHIFSMNAWEPLIWTLTAWILVRALRTGTTAWWVWGGLAAGLGLQNKHSMAFFGLALALGLVFSGTRRVLATRGPWILAGTAAAVFLPNVIWQVQHGWPTLEFMRNAQQVKINALSPGTYLAQQALLTNPVSVALWVPGLAWLLLSPAAHAWRFLGWAYLLLLAFFIVSGGKDYYLAPYYPILFAAGARAIEAWTGAAGDAHGDEGRARNGWLGGLRAALPAAILIVAAIGAPLALPVLPVDHFVRYAAALGVASAPSERHEVGRLPQFFADMFGWHELVDEVARAASTLPPADREKAVIYVGNYGEAGAINVLGRRRGTPPAISTHNNYYLWGPGRATPEILLVLGGSAEDHQECTSVERIGRFVCTDCMPYENAQDIWACRGLKVPIERVWRAEKHYN